MIAFLSLFTGLLILAAWEWVRLLELGYRLVLRGFQGAQPRSARSSSQRPLLGRWSSSQSGMKGRKP